MSEFLIWSEEHRRWWKPGHRGYTDVIAEAGRYSAEVAGTIEREANFGSTFNEIAMLVPGHLDALLQRSAPHAPADPVATVDERARELERAVNAELAKLGPAATDQDMDAVLAIMAPEGWEWVDATAVGGPRAIAFTRYGLAG